MSSDCGRSRGVTTLNGAMPGPPARELSKSVLRGRCALQTQPGVCQGPWISLEVPGNRCFEKPARKGPENWPRIWHRGRAGKAIWSCGQQQGKQDSWSLLEL